jgi:succinate dehydrogenase / fumarate reductase flavoprotein subunit
MVTGPAVATYRKNLGQERVRPALVVFDKAEKREQSKYERILKQNQDAKDARTRTAPPGARRAMLRDCTIERDNKTLDKVLEKIGELDERVKNVKCTDTSGA